jgi:Protein of unknown function (DUF2510)
MHAHAVCRQRRDPTGGDDSMSSQIPHGSSGWHPDPSGRYEFRYFNGLAWTQDVSINGVRFVDSGAVAPTASPSKAVPILGFLLGLGALLVAWIPFVFVVGAAAGIAAIVLGIVSLRRAKSGATAGRGFAVSGLVLGGVSLALCSVGIILTVKAVDEFSAYTNPGANEVTIERCETSGARLVIEGTITNLDDTQGANDTHDYDIAIEVRRNHTVVDVVHQSVLAVQTQHSMKWSTSMIVPSGTAGATIDCRVFSVNGPFPFGLKPN